MSTLEYAETIVTLAKRSDGKRGVLEEQVDVSENVYNNMATQTNASIPPVAPWWNAQSECLNTWTWHPDMRSEMLPFQLREKTMSGSFAQTSNVAVKRGIRIGTFYSIRFDKNSCMYEIYFSDCAGETGTVEYTRASDYSQTNGAGGNYKFATLKFFSDTGSSWRALLTANDKNSGWLESDFGIASFNIQ